MNFTSDRAFLDTNILIYAFDQADRVKQKTAAALVEHAFAHDYWISTQVLHEFYWNVTRKISTPLDPATAKTRVLRFAHLHHVDNLVEDIGPALTLKDSRNMNFWDALIIHAATRLSCRVVYSEDLKDGEEFDRTTVVNPFTSCAGA
ncbi:MAG: hypothetical protein A3G34_15985 [Candidatus Lindowbacteria bacterium RIFCSPLOWO2_12_FULL_62_27]|nr:MAG: hypothetical protein A3I06_12210 [Candidatus Lindowbacteria bacterium RIFCSPLOWO2_02_FULL_62_12]OGH61660.1 MAG: hypothetical protein A3G34_15985 [Candidatus Lindowbacteria bacterium RIFCSPLOWO2_12_FULL_62_27]